MNILENYVTNITYQREKFLEREKFLDCKRKGIL